MMTTRVSTRRSRARSATSDWFDGTGHHLPRRLLRTAEPTTDQPVAVASEVRTAERRHRTALLTSHRRQAANRSVLRKQCRAFNTHPTRAAFWEAQVVLDRPAFVGWLLSRLLRCARHSPTKSPIHQDAMDTCIFQACLVEFVGAEIRAEGSEYVGRGGSVWRLERLLAESALEAASIHPSLGSTKVSGYCPAQIAQVDIHRMRAARHFREALISERNFCHSFGKQVAAKRSFSSTLLLRSVDCLWWRANSLRSS